MDLFINIILILIIIILIYEINPNIFNDCILCIKKFSKFKNMSEKLSANLNSNFKIPLILNKSDAVNSSNSSNLSNSISQSDIALTTSDILNEHRNPFILDTVNDTYGRLSRKKNRTYNRFKKIDYDKLLGQEMTHVPWWGKNDE